MAYYILSSMPDISSGNYSFMRLSTEEKIILYTSQLNICEHHRYLLERLLTDAGNVDWNYIFRRTIQEGTTGLVYKTLKRMGHTYISSIPNIQAFSRFYSSLVYTNTLMFEKFKRVLGAFESHHIPVIILRGYALIHWIYKDPGLRPMDDIDILIKKSDVPAVNDILLQLGFRSPQKYPLLYTRDDLVLDVHLDIMGLSRIQSRRFGLDEDLALWWSHSRSISFLENDEMRLSQSSSHRLVHVLDPHDFIITSAIHQVKHSFGKLMWFVDIKEIIGREKPCFDWNGLLDRTNFLGLQRPLYYSLKYLKASYDVNVPPFILNDFHKTLNRFDTLIVNLLLENKKVPRWGDIIFLFNIKKPREKLRYLLETYFPRREVMSQMFDFSNPLMLYFLYILRFWQVIGVGSRACARLCSQSVELLYKKFKIRYPL